MTEIEKLHQLIEIKRHLVKDLYLYFQEQTDYEYEVAILKLELRFDDEIDIDLLEIQLNLMYENLKKVDTEIASKLVKIELLGFQIINV
jgi:hypothetical protein